MAFTRDEHAFLNVADGLKRRDSLIDGLVEENIQLRAERDAYLKHLDSSQAEVARLHSAIAEHTRRLNRHTSFTGGADYEKHNNAVAALQALARDPFLSAPAVQAADASANTTAAGAAPAPAAQAEDGICPRDGSLCESAGAGTWCCGESEAQS